MGTLVRYADDFVIIRADARAVIREIDAGTEAERIPRAQARLRERVDP